jgi:hypothetical protein
MTRQDPRRVSSLVALAISITALSVSIANFYLASLRAPHVEVRVAPYIRHGIDDTSELEAFFIPLTMANSGARSTSILSLELAIRHVPTGDEKTLYGQYFAENLARLGEFFTPIALPGYSDVSRTVAFYPLDQRTDRLFEPAGLYEFQLTAHITDMGGRFSTEIIQQEFSISLSPEQAAQIQEDPEFEYQWPLAIER